jgi:hypothetical protein
VLAHLLERRFLAGRLELDELNPAAGPAHETIRHTPVIRAYKFISPSTGPAHGLDQRALDRGLAYETA